VPWINRL